MAPDVGISDERGEDTTVRAAACAAWSLDSCGVGSMEADGAAT